jgi:hypothetical protein
MQDASVLLREADVGLGRLVRRHSRRLERL